MTKPKWTVDDQLLADVRDLLKAREPRPDPKPAQISVYGFHRVECPDCGGTMRTEAYNFHWSYYHGTRFWKEKALIKLISEATK